jgi:hypothetical protein
MNAHSFHGVNPPSFLTLTFPDHPNMPWDQTDLNIGILNNDRISFESSKCTVTGASIMVTPSFSSTHFYSNQNTPKMEHSSTSPTPPVTGTSTNIPQEIYKKIPTTVQAQCGLSTRALTFLYLPQI